MQKDATQAIHFGVTVGDGPSSSPTRLTSRSRRITRKTAWAAISLRSQQTGSTFRAIRCSIQSKQQVVPESNFRKNTAKEICDAKVFIDNGCWTRPGSCDRF